MTPEQTLALVLKMGNLGSSRHDEDAHYIAERLAAAGFAIVPADTQARVAEAERLLENVCGWDLHGGYQHKQGIIRAFLAQRPDGGEGSDMSEYPVFGRCPYCGERMTFAAHTSSWLAASPFFLVALVGIVILLILAVQP